MSEQMPEETPYGDLSAFDVPVPGVRWAGRRTLAGAVAAAVTVGLGAAGFLFVSSTPGSSEAFAGVPSTRTTESSTPAPTASDGVAFAVSGRDVFAGAVAPAAGTAATTGAASSAAAPGVGTGTGGGSAPAVASSPAAARPGSAAGATSSTGTRTTAPAAPTRTPGLPVAVPTPTRSTAVPWVKGSVSLVAVRTDSAGTAEFTLATDGIDPVTRLLSAGSLVPSTSTVYQPHGTTTDRAMTDDEKAACQKSIQNAATTEAAEKIRRVSKDCTVVEDYVWQAVFTPSSQAAAAAGGTEQLGWLVPAGAALPDAVLGKVSGTVRFLGQAGGKYLVQAGNAAPQWIAAGGAVDGTPLTFTGLGLDSIERPDVAVFTDGTSQFFTVLGGGEGSGVTY